MYHSCEGDPTLFEKKNVLYHYPINRDRLVIGKFCSIASGVRFLFNSANHALGSLSTYPFPLFLRNGPGPRDVADAWDNRGDIVVGNDVWITVKRFCWPASPSGDGAIIGARALVTRMSRPIPSWAAFRRGPSGRGVFAGNSFRPAEAEMVGLVPGENPAEHCGDFGGRAG